MDTTQRPLSGYTRIERDANGEIVSTEHITFERTPVRWMMPPDDLDSDARLLTPQLLRFVLFYLSDQEMTVGELRRRLCQIDGQCEPLKITSDMWRRLGIESPDEF